MFRSMITTPASRSPHEHLNGNSRIERTLGKSSSQRKGLDASHVLVTNDCRVLLGTV